MTDSKQAWSEVADRCGELRLMLNSHFEQASDRPYDASLRKALEDLKDSVDHAVDAVGSRPS
jgi:hypothetical protein